ncbi:hypothetical protein LCGC14_1461170 [marine sediment metagenome]|uniref:Uncharacterized protein n=1 Tax=marine sediment metagenome TaxID=412755 RepID=A0A0F9LVP2_9ZZZZ
MDDWVEDTSIDLNAAKSHLIEVRLSPTEMRAVAEVARFHRVSVHDYIRQCTLDVVFGPQVTLGVAGDTNATC